MREDNIIEETDDIVIDLGVASEETKGDIVKTVLELPQSGYLRQ